MTISTKTLAALCGALAVAGAMTVSSAPAEAKGFKIGGFHHHHHGHWGGRGFGWGAAGVGLGLAGLAIASSAPVYAGDCYIVRKAVWSDYYGATVIRRVRVCN